VLLSRHHLRNLALIASALLLAAFALVISAPRASAASDCDGGNDSAHVHTVDADNLDDMQGIEEIQYVYTFANDQCTLFDGLRFAQDGDNWFAWGLVPTTSPTKTPNCVTFFKKIDGSESQGSECYATLTAGDSYLFVAVNGDVNTCWALKTGGVQLLNYCGLWTSSSYVGTTSQRYYVNESLHSDYSSIQDCNINQIPDSNCSFSDPADMSLQDNTSTGGTNPWVYCKESSTEVAVHQSC
jgi:hypothetical protein